MNTATAPAADLTARLARLDAAADFYQSEIDRLNSEARAAKAAGDSDRLAEIREARAAAWRLFDFACDRAAALRAAAR